MGYMYGGMHVHTADNFYRPNVAVVSVNGLYYIID